MKALDDSYQVVADLARRLDYTAFTGLQERVFRNEKTFSHENWLFVIGNTSSGKTLIPLLLYFAQFRQNKHPRMLFAVPYRALAAQKDQEIRQVAEKLGMELNIQQCTGEFRGADMEIRMGQVDIAVIIYEKVFMFSSMDDQFLERYDFLVLDEIALTQHVNRGIKADFTLARARRSPRLRVIALGTPFYDWETYIRNYDFTSVCETGRPVELKVNPVYCTRGGINYVPPGCEAVSRRMARPYKNDPNAPNQIQWRDQVVEDICRYHLRRNHRILIFENNREEVRLRSQRLHRVLAAEGLLRPWISPEECRHFVCEQIGISESDVGPELYHIMEQEDFAAFACGVSYHNALLPNPLRSLVERQILEQDGHLRIVCSTETLAYGINSNVDVVIIPNMLKQKNDVSQQNAFLTANEYMNYAGRAGRLRQGVGEQFGYVYPLIRDIYRGEGEARPPLPPGRIREQDGWEQVLWESEHPSPVHSLYFTVDPESKPFYLLSLFPNQQGLAYSARTTAELADTLCRIPAPNWGGIQMGRDLEQPLGYLLDKGLVRVCQADDDIDDDAVPEYQLTDIGAAMTGYIIRQDDFDNVMVRACQSVGQNFWYLIDVLYQILDGKELQHLVENGIGSVQKLDDGQRGNVLREVAQILQRYRQSISPALQKELYLRYGIVMEGGSGVYPFVRTASLDNRLRILGALLYWVEESFTARELYKTYCMGSQQLKRIAQRVSYQLDIVQLSLPAFIARQSCGGAPVVGRERIQEIQELLSDTSKSLYYQVLPEYCQIFDVSVKDPITATKLRGLMKLYLRLERLERAAAAGGLKRKKDRHDLRRARDLVNKEQQDWKTVYYQRFGGLLDHAD